MKIETKAEYDALRAELDSVRKRSFPKGSPEAQRKVQLRAAIKAYELENDLDPFYTWDPPGYKHDPQALVNALMIVIENGPATLDNPSPPPIPPGEGADGNTDDEGAPDYPLPEGVVRRPAKTARPISRLRVR